MTAAPHQLERIEHLRNMGAMSGISRGAEDMEAIYNNWRNNYGKR